MSMVAAINAKLKEFAKIKILLCRFLALNSVLGVWNSESFFGTK
jgi:hypothetical protein